MKNAAGLTSIRDGLEKNTAERLVSDKMIINVGGRTDIVNYYTPWLLNRLSEGYAYSRNPFARVNVY